MKPEKLKIDWNKIEREYDRFDYFNKETVFNFFVEKVDEQIEKYNKLGY